MDRRDFLFACAGGALLSPAGTNSLASVAQTRHTDSSIKAVAFDALPGFDPRPILKVSKTLFPDHEG